jgi:hypothetical protein
MESLRPLEELMRSESEAELASILNEIYSEGLKELRPRLATVENSSKKMINEGRAVGFDFDAAA